MLGDGWLRAISNNRSVKGLMNMDVSSEDVYFPAPSEFPLLALIPKLRDLLAQQRGTERERKRETFGVVPMGDFSSS